MILPENDPVLICSELDTVLVGRKFITWTELDTVFVGNNRNTWTELDTTPVGNNCVTWVELVTTPPPNAVIGILPLRIRLPNIEVFDGIEILVIKDIMYK